MVSLFPGARPCPEGTHAYTTGCSQKMPEATCDVPNPVKEKAIICDYSACYCNAPTVRDKTTGKCVPLDQCPKKKEEEVPEEVEGEVPEEVEEEVGEEVEEEEEEEEGCDSSEGESIESESPEIDSTESDPLEEHS
jgi:hypothetical protein